MSDASFHVLLGTAASLALVHTVIGVDHVVPFIALGRAQRWSLARTLAITALCGLGHVATSIILGLAGIGLGLAIEDLVPIQELRGRLTVYGLVGFGLLYAAIALVRLRRGHEHRHPSGAVTAWMLFILFAFGPCEALIPLMMAPAIIHDWTLLAAIVSVFSTITVGTMLVLVGFGYAGMRWQGFKSVERYLHVASGLMIAASGAAIQVLGI